MTEAERKAWNEAIEAAAVLCGGLPSVVPIERALVGTRDRTSRDYAAAIRSLTKPEPTE